MGYQEDKDTVTFFPTGTADMTLVKLRNGMTLLIDCYLQEEKSGYCHTIFSDLVDCLSIDDQDRPYVDVFLQTHPDLDHCKGADTYLHLAPLEEYEEDAPTKKIVIREIWSSPLVFKRRSKSHDLCDDAAAINKEAKRRVNLFKESYSHKSDVPDGDRIEVLGEDYKYDDGTDRLSDIEEIRTKVGESIKFNDGEGNQLLEVKIRAPKEPGNDAEEEKLSKNNSSVISQWIITAPAPHSMVDNKLLFGGDASVEIWRHLGQKHANDAAALEYDILLAPHHCSWGVFSHQSAKDAEAADDYAKFALKQRRDEAHIVSSSKPIKEDSDPPSTRAKDEYIGFLQKSSKFICTGEHPTESAPEPLIFELTSKGCKAPSKKTGSNNGKSTAIAAAAAPRPHG